MISRYISSYTSSKLIKLIKLTLSYRLIPTKKKKKKDPFTINIIKLAQSRNYNFEINRAPLLRVAKPLDFDRRSTIHTRENSETERGTTVPEDVRRTTDARPNIRRYYMCTFLPVFASTNRRVSGAAARHPPPSSPPPNRHQLLPSFRETIRFSR